MVRLFWVFVFFGGGAGLLFSFVFLEARTGVHRGFMRFHVYSRQSAKRKANFD